MVSELYEFLKINGNTGQPSIVYQGHMLTDNLSPYFRRMTHIISSLGVCIKIASGGLNKDEEKLWLKKVQQT